MSKNILKKLAETFSDNETIPNKLTRGLGELIRQAREEVNLSQDELAEHSYMRQSTISDIENGRIEISVSQLLYLSYALNKPITYFFPKGSLLISDESPLSEDEFEMLIYAKRLSRDNLKRVIAQIKDLAEME